MRRAWRSCFPGTVLLVMLSLWPVFSRDLPESAAMAQTASASSAGQSFFASPEKVFEAAEVISASDVEYPIHTTVEGIVILDVTVNVDGGMAGVETLSDVPPLTGAAQSSLRSWKFKPASLDGVPEVSQILIAFAFRHAVRMWSPPPFSAVFASKEQGGYMPAGIFVARYADYPASTIAAGATVVQATVQANGKTGDVSVVRAMGGFTGSAVKAAKAWEFQPAVLDGSPVTSKVAIAFVFSSRAVNPF